VAGAAPADDPGQRRAGRPDRGGDRRERPEIRGLTVTGAGPYDPAPWRCRRIGRCGLRELRTRSSAETGRPRFAPFHPHRSLHPMLPADRPAERTPRRPTHRFSVLAAAEASVMSRTLELFAKRGLVPERVDARRERDALAIDLE